MTPLGLIWAALIVLKLAGIAFVTTSWLLILFWPIVPLLIILILVMLGAVGVAAFNVRRR